MKTPDELKSAATDLVSDILSRRLRRGGIVTSHPEHFFRCVPLEPEPFPEGFQVRVNTWRQWSDATVEYDADTGELMGWTIFRHADPAHDSELTREKALEIAAKEIPIPDGAEVESFYHYDFAPRRRVARIEWRHMHQGLRVEGDYLWVLIHPQTHRIIELKRKWRAPRLR